MAYISEYLVSQSSILIYESSSLSQAGLTVTKMYYVSLCLFSKVPFLFPNLIQVSASLAFAKSKCQQSRSLHSLRQRQKW